MADGKKYFYDSWTQILNDENRRLLTFRRPQMEEEFMFAVIHERTGLMLHPIPEKCLRILNNKQAMKKTQKPRLLNYLQTFLYF